jgi:UDP-N-acetyl-D-galactosamine dehydrogenase
MIDSDYFIITVPTPLKKNNKPDLSPLKKASKLVGKLIKRGAIIIFESTVYPGCTEDDCIPIIEKYSNLNFNKDFYVGYSPERINPGDKKRKLKDIVKVVSGSTPLIADEIQSLYNSIITAGTYLAPSIRVAEASKIIENVQRDVNISLVNEFALIFEKLNLDTTEVLNTASTKWNFLNFKPGLVGGHCIGVDPYYLAHKATLSGYKPKVLINGRKVNNSISKNIVLSIQKKAKSKKIIIQNARVLILGIAFKENCSDIRNSRVADLHKELEKVSLKVDVHDYLADKLIVKKEFGIELIQDLNNNYDIIVLAVSHNKYLKLDYAKLLKKNHILYDVKSVLPKNIITLRL